MTRIIAAVTGDSAASAVLSSAGAIAPLFSATVDALHVGGEQAFQPPWAGRSEVVRRMLAGLLRSVDGGRSRCVASCRQIASLTP